MPSPLYSDPQSELHEGDARPGERRDGVNGPSNGDIVRGGAACELSIEK